MNQFEDNVDYHDGLSEPIVTLSTDRPLHQLQPSRQTEDRMILAIDRIIGRYLSRPDWPSPYRCTFEWSIQDRCMPSYTVRLEIREPTNRPWFAGAETPEQLFVFLLLLSHSCFSALYRTVWNGCRHLLCPLLFFSRSPCWFVLPWTILRICMVPVQQLVRHRWTMAVDIPFDVHWISFRSCSAMPIQCSTVVSLLTSEHLCATNNLQYGPMVDKCRFDRLCCLSYAKQYPSDKSVLNSQSIFEGVPFWYVFVLVHVESGHCYLMVVGQNPIVTRPLDLYNDYLLYITDLTRL